MNINFNLLFTALSLIVTVYVFKATPKQELLKERYEKLLFPLYECLEPYLYVDYKTVPFSTALDILNSKKLYSSLKLIERAYYLNEQPNQQNYNSFCKRLIWEYNFLAFSRGLGIHSITYRINRNQYRTKFAFWFYTIFWSLVLLLAFFLMLFAFTYIGSLILKLSSL